MKYLLLLCIFPLVLCNLKDWQVPPGQRQAVDLEENNGPEHCTQLGSIGSARAVSPQWPCTCIECHCHNNCQFIFCWAVTGGQKPTSIQTGPYCSSVNGKDACKAKKTNWRDYCGDTSGNRRQYDIPHANWEHQPHGYKWCYDSSKNGPVNVTTPGGYFQPGCQGPCSCVLRDTDGKGNPLGRDHSWIVCPGKKDQQDPTREKHRCDCSGGKCGCTTNHTCWGKYNETKWCNRICYQDGPRTVCFNPEYNLSDHLWWLSYQTDWCWLFLVIMIFWFIISHWHWWWMILKWIFRKMKPDNPFKPKVVKRGKYITKVNMGGVTARTDNWCLMLLLLLISLGCIRPTRAVQIGPREWGHPFFNQSGGSVTVFGAYGDTTCMHDYDYCYEWKTTSFGGHDCCFGSEPEDNICYDKGKPRPEFTCVDQVVGGGWAQHCFCVGNNRWYGCCLHECQDWCRHHQCVESGSHYVIKVESGGKVEMVHVNGSGTHQGEGWKITISGCNQRPGDDVCIWKGMPMSGRDCKQADQYSHKPWVPTGCGVHVAADGGTNVMCNPPGNCEHDPDYSHEGHWDNETGWTEYLTCDYTFDWTTVGCQAPTNNTPLMCHEGICTVTCGNISSCCTQDGQQRSNPFMAKCPGCTFEGKQAIYQPRDKHQDWIHPSHHDPGQGDPWWKQLFRWFVSWTWSVERIIILCMFIFFVFFVLIRR